MNTMNNDWSYGGGGGGGGKINECPCPKGQKCVSAKSGSGNRYCVLKGVVGGGDTARNLNRGARGGGVYAARNLNRGARGGGVYAARNLNRGAGVRGILPKGSHRSFEGLPTETGVAPIDTAITRTLAFEQSYLGNPLIQFALLGLAGFGVYTLITKA